MSSKYFLVVLYIVFFQRIHPMLSQREAASQRVDAIAQQALIENNCWRYGPFSWFHSRECKQIATMHEITNTAINHSLDAKLITQHVEKFEKYIEGRAFFKEQI